MKFFLNAKNDYIVSRPSNDDTEGQFAKVESAPPQQYLEVEAVGENVKSCKVGDHILPYGQDFQAFKRDDKQYVVLRDDQVIGVFNV